MSVVDHLSEFLASLAPHQVALVVAAASASLLVIEERRLSLLPLLMQYLLAGPLASSGIYRPVIFARIGLGVAVCLILYVTARHVQRELDALARSPANGNKIWHVPIALALRSTGFTGMRVVFRLALVALAGLAAFGIWRAYPLTSVPASINLTGYWLVSIGLLLTLTSVDPLRMGFGVLTFVNGFEGIYLYLEQSLVVIGLLGVLNILVALAIATCSESWLESLRAETSG